MAKILISGICGFVGATLAHQLAQRGHIVCGFDNFIRPGSETNRAHLKQAGVKIFHADLRLQSDIDSMPACDWVIDAAANPSVLAGVDGLTSSRQLVEHNLGGTMNLLEYCKRHRAGFILLSTSRVYGIRPLSNLKVNVVNNAFSLDQAQELPPGITTAGLDENFTTGAPISLYGATKLASEAMALEYGETFGFPVYINRCGVLAGGGQFGRPDQGIFAYWINAYMRKRPLRYIGFGGSGHQVRDCLHPRDLVSLIEKQFREKTKSVEERILNLSGGLASAMSLCQLTQWCCQRYGQHSVAADLALRPFDIPWIVLNPAKAKQVWNWQPETPVLSILDEISNHAADNPDWLDLSAPY